MTHGQYTHSICIMKLKRNKNYLFLQSFYENTKTIYPTITKVLLNLSIILLYVSSLLLYKYRGKISFVAHSKQCIKLKT